MKNLITAYRRRALAVENNVNEQYLYQCLTGRRDMGPAEAVRLEIATHGELSRRMLCHKSYAAIWPELADVGNPASGIPTPEQPATAGA